MRVSGSSSRPVSSPPVDDSTSEQNNNNGATGAAQNNNVGNEEMQSQLSTLRQQRDDPGQAQYRATREAQISDLESRLGGGASSSSQGQGSSGSGSTGESTGGSSNNAATNGSNAPSLAAATGPTPTAASASEPSESPETSGKSETAPATGTSAASGSESGKGDSGGARTFGNGVAIDGKNITRNGQPHTIKAVGYSAENQGFELANGGYQDPSTTYDTVNKDFAKIAATGANTVRTYDPFLDVPGVFEQMDKAAENNNLDLLVSFPKNEPEKIAEFVKANKDNDTIAGYIVGNEVNGNNFYGTSSNPDQTSVDLSKTIREADGGNHPIYSSYGEIPSDATLAKLENEGEFDGHTINYYRNPATESGYADPLREFAQKTDKPVVLGEYGTDSYDNTAGQENRQSQKIALRMTNEHVGKMFADGTLQGASVFGYKDQIHRSDADNAVDAYINGTGSYSAEPAYALGFRPDPNVPAIDGVQNDEYLGITDASGNEKPVYSEVSRFFGST